MEVRSLELHPVSLVGTGIEALGMCSAAFLCILTGS